MEHAFSRSVTQRKSSGSLCFCCSLEPHVALQEEAKAFLVEPKVHQSERILLINSRHAAIDAVLNQKGYAARQRGIDMRFRVNDLSALKLPRVDVTIVLGNLIDNAREACLNLPESERWVSIQLMYSPPLFHLAHQRKQACSNFRRANAHLQARPADARVWTEQRQKYIRKIPDRILFCF